MRITRNHINNQTYVSVYLMENEQASEDTLGQLKKQYKHVAVVRSGTRPIRDALTKALA